MPPISTHMHFGKIFIENSDEEVDIQSFILGMAAPDTCEDDETYEELHCLDEDGNIDVREFYEKFDMKNLLLCQKSFVLGYYCHLWLDEYYKFNASKLTIHNSLDLPDEELAHAVKDLVKYYDEKVIGNYYADIKNTIKNYDKKIDLKELSHISIKKCKEKLLEYFDEKIPEEVYIELMSGDDYINLIYKSCSKIIKSL